MIRLALHWQILIGILLACLAGWLSGREGELFGLVLYDVYDFLGTLFLNGLKMIVVPLVMASIITGMSGMGTSDSFGRMGIKTLSFYLVSSLAAILLGLALVNLFQPGIIDGQPAGERLNLHADAAELDAVLETVEGSGTGDIVGVFLRMVPPNIVEAAAQGEMLGLIFFSLLFGFFMTRITPRYSQVMQDFWQGVFETMMKITLWIMAFAPVGVFGLVAKTVATTGFGAFMPMLVFFMTVALGLVLHLVVTMGLALWALGRVHPFAHLRAMAPALLTAFSTASSSATLPLTIKCVESGSGVSNRTSGFVLPLGATINMDGAAITITIMTLAAANTMGIHVSFATAFVLSVVSALAACGASGVAGGSLLLIPMACSLFGISNDIAMQVVGVGFIIGVVQDSVETALNSSGDVLFAATAEYAEWRKQGKPLPSFLGGRKTVKRKGKYSR